LLAIPCSALPSVACQLPALNPLLQPVGYSIGLSQPCLVDASSSETGLLATGSLRDGLRSDPLVSHVLRGTDFFLWSLLSF
jgi:hypothetical protein